VCFVTLNSFVFFLSWCLTFRTTPNMIYVINYVASAGNGDHVVEGSSSSHLKPAVITRSKAYVEIIKYCFWFSTKSHWSSSQVNTFPSPKLNIPNVKQNNFPILFRQSLPLSLSLSVCVCVLIIICQSVDFSFCY